MKALKDVKGIARTSLIILVVAIIAIAGIGIGTYIVMNPTATPTPAAFVCPTDGETFATKAELNQHLWTDTTPAHPKIPLTIWGWSGNEQILNRTAIETGFTTTYPNIELKPVAQAGTGAEYDLLTQAASSGSGAADLVGIEVDWGARFIPMDILLPLNQYGAMDYANKFPAWFWNSYVDNNTIYGIPWDASGAGALFYRSDVFDKYGLTVPTTMAEWKAVGQELKTKNSSWYLTFMPPDSSQIQFEMLIDSQGGPGIFRKNTDGTWVSNLDSAEALRALNFMEDLVDTGLAKAAPMWNDEMYAEMGDDVYATVLCAQWYTSSLSTWLDMDTTHWKVAAFPQWTAGTPTSANRGGTSYCITTQSANPDAAWELLKWLFLSKNNARTLYQNCKYYPAYTELQTDPVVAIDDPYFGGQNVNAFIAANSMPYVNFHASPYSNLFNTYCNAMLQEVLLGTKSPEQGLTDAKANIDRDIAAGL